MSKKLTIIFFLFTAAAIITAQENSGQLREMFIKFKHKVEADSMNIRLYQAEYDSLKKAAQRMNYTDEVVSSVEKKFDYIKKDFIYVVKQGDYLSKIAQRNEFFNNYLMWQKIFSVNKDKIKNPNLIYPDQKLIIPYEIYQMKRRQSVDFDPEIVELPDILEVKPTIPIRNKITQDGVEFTSLIVNETQTKTGNDFYDLFFSKWQYSNEQVNYTIVITEKPLPQQGTQVTIIVNDTEVLQQFIQPKNDLLEEAADYCVQFTTGYLENFEVIQKELYGKDLQGTGIY